MYTILICDDNSLMTTKRERIMQRSKLVDNLQFLVPQFYNDLDMSKYTVQLEYILPCSRKYCTEILNLSNEMYKDHLRYTLPFDTQLTAEHGEIAIQLTFVRADLDMNGNGIQRVRKTSTTTINIVPISAWSDIIPDAALSAIDERLIKLDAQMRGLNDYMNVLDNTQVDNLVYNEKDETLHLSANGNIVGNKVSIKNIMSDGIPVVDLDSDSGDSGNIDTDNNNNGCNCCNCGCEDNVVEFGDVVPTTPNEDNNVVEF